MERPARGRRLHGVAARILAFARLRRGRLETVVPSFDGVPIAFDSLGSGSPAIVFVHGWSCDRTDFEGQLELPWQIVRIELAGHGASGVERSTWTVAAFGEDVAAVVRFLDLQRLVLVGHSMGGDIAVAAARLLPGRVVGIVWVDVHDELSHGRTPLEIEQGLVPFRQSFAPAVESFVRGMFAPSTSSTLVSRIVERLASASPAIALPCLRAAWSAHAETRAALRELKLPMVSIHPSDGSCDEEDLRSYGVEVVRMAGVRHFPMLEDPSEFNRVLTEIVSRWSPAAASEQEKR